MPIPRSVLMVELLMSADRVIDAARTTEPADDAESWPPATIIGHLSQVDEQVWLPRLELMVTSVDVPAFTWWEPDPAATRVAFATTSIDEAGARLLASRTGLLHRLRELDDASWAAAARHDVFGVLDVEGLMIQVLGHDEEHRASLVLAPERNVDQP
jgi:hypothetical protein